MDQKVQDRTSVAGIRGRAGLAIGQPPIPREHGAWVILYAPLVIGFAVAGRFAILPALLLTLAVTGAYLARYAGDVALRRRDQSGPRFWLAVYLMLFVIGGLSLVTAYQRTDLIVVGGAIALVFAIHAALSQRRARRRFDRTAAGELLAIVALVATGPAAVVTLQGSFNPLALHLWLLCALFFASGVLHVNMYLAAVRIRGAFSSADRSRVRASSLAYHLLLTVAFPVAAALALRATVPAAIATLAVVPALVRAFRGAATVTNCLPPLKRVGIQETLYALWFTARLITAFAVR